MTSEQVDAHDKPVALLRPRGRPLVQNFFSAIDASQAPHGNFWKQSSDPNTSYQAFVNGNVPGGSQTANPGTGQPLPIVTKGDGEHSNIIYALRGTIGTFWDKNNPNSAFGQMPYGGPYFSDDQIDELADWITTAAPNNGAAPSAAQTPKIAIPLLRRATTGLGERSTSPGRRANVPEPSQPPVRDATPHARD